MQNSFTENELSLTFTYSTNFDWDRSFSEPDLTDPFKGLNRFTIKNPHEYISVDDLKYYRRKKPPDLHTRSNICFYNKDETVQSPSSHAVTTEYQKQFHALDLSFRPGLLRRSTSLHLEGLMHHISEHQEQYHWYTPEDCHSCRALPIKNPETFHLDGDTNMNAEYRSSYISYPMLDRTTKILPREMFHIEPDAAITSNTAIMNNVENKFDHSSEEIAAINRLAEDKFKRDVAAQEQHKCHLQQRAAATHYDTMPSEYKRQFVQFPIEKAHSIPQISHINMKGAFMGIPEYQDSYKMYANYSKSAPIKKVDNLRISGAEMEPCPDEGVKVPEYREKFRTLPKDGSKTKSLKTDDHLHVSGEFSKDIPEYYESFRDPQIKEMPERGKCREPYLRLKGKLEFNPEYRNTYLDFPRSRPIVRKPASSFRLPTSTTTAASMNVKNSKSPKHTSRRKYKSSSPNRLAHEPQMAQRDLTVTPEYRRANYNYQLRERTPPRKYNESDGGGGTHYMPTKTIRKYSDSSTDPPPPPHIYNTPNANKKRTTCNRQTSVLDTSNVVAGQRQQQNFENVGNNPIKKPAKFGRRSSTVLQNAVNCRTNSSIIEANPKYTLTMRKDQMERENQDSFVVLDEPCKRTNWMKKSWYES